MANDNGTNWIDEALEDADDTARRRADSKSSQQGDRLSVQVCRKECNSCGTTTVRGYHDGCNSPILRIGGEWQCSGCGVRITPGRCPECNSSTDLATVQIPIDLSFQAQSDEIEHAVHKETNRQRTDHGLQTLEYSPHLSAIALQHSRDMAQRDFFDHNTPDGKGANDRYRIFGHDTKSSGENIALEHPALTSSPRNAAQSVVDGWMNSKGHRENILRKQFTQEGIGVYIDPSGAIYVTQNFY